MSAVTQDQVSRFQSVTATATATLIARYERFSCMTYYLEGLSVACYSQTSQGDLVCFQRDDQRAVPGCLGQGISGWDYCYKHNPNYGPLVLKGSNPTFKLGACEGDCDSDADCLVSLVL